MKLPKVERAYKVLCQLTPAEVEAIWREAAESIDVPLRVRRSIGAQLTYRHNHIPTPDVAQHIAWFAARRRRSIRAQQKTPARMACGGGRGRARARGRIPGPPRR